jgi:hypothetical protein
MTEAKGIVLVKDESGNEKIYTKYIYLRMMKSGRKIEFARANYRSQVDAKHTHNIRTR